MHLLGSAGTVHIRSVTADGDFAVLPASAASDCAADLSPTASCRLQIAFTPTTLRQRRGTLTVTTDQGTVSAALTGTGAGGAVLALAPTSLTLPSLGVPATLTLRNTSPVTLTLGTPTARAPR